MLREIGANNRYGVAISYKANLGNYCCEKQGIHVPVNDNEAERISRKLSLSHTQLKNP